MYCSNCGKEISDESIFCGYCGKIVDTSQNVAPNTNEVGQTESPKNDPNETNRSIKVSFCAKKQFGQFLVSNVILEIGNQQYRFPFNVTTKINVPEGLQSITCYMDYLGKSGLAKSQFVFSPDRQYQILYTSPMVVTSPGKMTIS